MSKLGGKKILLFSLFVAFAAGWIYWNRPLRDDLSSFAPSDCLAYLEVNDLPEVLSGFESAEAWRALAEPIGARSKLLPRPWLVRLARWTGIGSADAVILARSQIAIAVTGTRSDEAGATLTIRPLAAVIIETHSFQRRIRPTLGRHIEEFARRVFANPHLVRKQIDGVDFDEWSSADGSRQIVTAFLDSAAVVGNDESSVISCVEAKRRRRATLAEEKLFNDAHQRAEVASSGLFGFASKSGLKLGLQAYALKLSLQEHKTDSSSDALTASRVFAETLGNLVEGVGCRSQFVEGSAEDHCSIVVAEGVAEKLRPSTVPQDRTVLDNLPFVPSDAYSISIYSFRDIEGFWRDLNAVVASHADLLGAMVAHSVLRAMLAPYGISDPDAFVHAVGTRIETIRLEENAPAVLVVQALDRETLRRIAGQRIGVKPTTESVGDFNLLISSYDNWAVSFADNHFLIGPAESVRRCLQAKAQSQSLNSVEGFRRSAHLVDVSLPLNAVTFTNDQNAAISFVELFSERERPTFSANANSIFEAARSLPYTVNVITMKDNGFEWTSRSAFGLMGSLITALAPEKSR